MGLTTAAVRAHAHALQQQFIAGLRGEGVRASDLVVADAARGQFLTFRTPQARAISAALKSKQVTTDARDDRLRFGFGPYLDSSDVERLLALL